MRACEQGGEGAPQLWGCGWLEHREAAAGWDRAGAAAGEGGGGRRPGPCQCPGGRGSLGPSSASRPAASSRLPGSALSGVSGNWPSFSVLRGTGGSLGRPRGRGVFTALLSPPLTPPLCSPFPPVPSLLSLVVVASVQLRWQAARLSPNCRRAASLSLSHLEWKAEQRPRVTTTPGSRAGPRGLGGQHPACGGTGAHGRARPRAVCVGGRGRGSSPCVGPASGPRLPHAATRARRRPQAHVATLRPPVLTVRSGPLPVVPQPVSEPL